MNERVAYLPAFAPLLILFLLLLIQQAVVDQLTQCLACPAFITIENRRHLLTGDRRKGQGSCHAQRKPCISTHLSHATLQEQGGILLLVQPVFQLLKWRIIQPFQVLCCISTRAAQIAARNPQSNRPVAQLLANSLRRGRIRRALAVGVEGFGCGLLLQRGKIKHYQDGSAFLTRQGQRGPQLDVLRPGTYYINPFMFSVETDDVAVVERGQVGVVVSNVGEEPTKEMKQRLGSSQIDASEEEGKEKYVVPTGFRGIQEEVAGPGRYYLNRRAFMVYIIDTTNITIDWDDQKETRFDQLNVISKDGFPIQVSVKVVIRVRPDQAPYMVAKVGSIDNLIQHVISIR